MFRRPLTLKIELAYTEVNLTIALKKRHRLDKPSLVLEEATSTRVHLTKEGQQRFRFWRATSLLTVLLRRRKLCQF
jgi:hypothetical protein